MGAPTKTQIETWTDAIAAIVQKDMDGFASEYSAKSAATLYDLIDLSGDPNVETALGGAALNVDAMSLPEHVRDWLPGITGRTSLRDFARAVNTLVTSAGGGGYASLRAYLSAVSAKLHPLAGEVFRRALQEGVFTSSNVVAGVGNPTYGAMFPTKVFTGADGSLSSDLADAINATTADVAIFATDDYCLYIGSDRPFQGLVVALSTLASVTVEPTFQYWNGNAWTTLSVTDNTSGFTKNDIVTFTPPTDWTRYHKDAGGTVFPSSYERLYYVRVSRTANTLVTPPVGTCVTVIPTVITTTENGTAHAAIEQPPLAICRITGASAMTVTAPANIDTTRWAVPLSSESKLRMRALTPIANDLTVTLGYVDQSGNNDSVAQSSWTAPAALTTATIALNSGDGLKSVRTTATTVSTSATAGVFVVECIPIRTPAI